MTGPIGIRVTVQGAEVVRRYDGWIHITIGSVDRWFSPKEWDVIVVATTAPIEPPAAVNV